MDFPVLLLAEDETCARQIADTLEGREVIQCRTPEQARQWCRDRDIGVVLVVHGKGLPVGEGFLEDLAGLRPGIVGILLTSRVTGELSRLAFESGFAGVLELPPKPMQLLRQMDRAQERIDLQVENTRLKTLLPLYSLGEQFLSSQTEQDVLECLLDAVEDLTAAEQITVMLYRQAEDDLHIAAARGMDQSLADSIVIQPGEQIAGWVYAKGKSVILNRENQHLSSFAQYLKRPEIASAISFPLTVRGRTLGVLNISRTQSGYRFSEADGEMLAIVTSQAALALENIRFIKSMETSVRMRTLFEQYVSPQVADLLLRLDTNPMTLGEIKEVTVFFADIRNFTGLVQHLPLADLRRFLNDFFELFAEAVFENRGTIDKFMGDAVLAVFGAPVELEEPELAAIATARMIREGFLALQDRWKLDCSVFSTVDLGIAITRGEAFLGNVGSEKRLDYTVIGNQVNIAQRLAAESSQAAIYVTESVQIAVKGKVATEALGDLQLRGVELPITVYRIPED